MRVLNEEENDLLSQSVHVSVRVFQGSNHLCASGLILCDCKPLRPRETVLVLKY